MKHKELHNTTSWSSAMIFFCSKKLILKWPACAGLRKPIKSLDQFFVANVHHPCFNYIQVYCEMEMEGGGWTLVAVVHQYDDNQCSDVNRWYGNTVSIS